MTSVLSEIKEIPDLPHDSVIPISLVNIYGLLYKDDEGQFNLIMFDVLGEIINAVEFEPDPDDFDFNKFKFTPFTVAFCKLLIRDVFTDTEIYGTIELPQIVDDFFTKNVKESSDFMNSFYTGLYEKFVETPTFN